MYMLWQRRWRLALLVAIAPSIAVSYALMRWVDLELYKHSQFGQYLAVYYDPADASAACGAAILLLGAWWRRPWRRNGSNLRVRHRRNANRSTIDSIPPIV
jgi:hypothetical protein